MTNHEDIRADDAQFQGYIPNPTPLDATYATWFTPTDPAILVSARRALASYRQWYQEREREFPPYPYRMVIARPTGLPIFLRGFLDMPIRFSRDNDQEVIAAADRWLFADRHVRALFGLSTEEARQRLRLAPAPLRVRFGERSGEVQSVDKTGKQVWDQIERELAESAVRLAPQAHVHFQQWHGNRPLFGARVVAHLTSEDGRASVTSSYCPIADDKRFNPVFNSPEAAFSLAFQALNNYVHSAEYAERIGLPIPDLGKWHLHIAPYIRQPQFIFPFAGDYHLVYQVAMTSPDQEQTWRAFVDCERQIVLGRPEPLKLHAQYYEVASHVLAQPPVLQPIQVDDNHCANFLEIGIYQESALINDGVVDWSQSNSPGKNFEAANVAVHARRIFDYFVQLGVAQADLEAKFIDNNNVTHPGLRARVAKPGLPQLDMGFHFEDSLIPQQRWISFQTDNSLENDGLPVLTGKRVHHPTYDPEVIYHEFTHALMWLMNRSAFDGCNGNVPFGRALLEGYANYFGRSLATRFEAQNRTAPANQPWAQAAYRTETTTAAWGDRWALDRWALVLPEQIKEVDGQDRLPAPNLYPTLATTGLPVYDVGMVLARGLWDLRAEVLPLDVDRFALAAFDYLHGWIATFELVVEGMIDVAKDIVGFDTLAETTFSARRIVANQRIQAITSLGTTVLVGADAGLMRSLSDGQSWHDWSQSGNALAPLRNVVALTVDENNDTFYAATEAGVWQRTDADAAWQRVGNWPPDQTPYGLSVFAGTIYVGTGNGVWYSPTTAPAWQPLHSGDPVADFVGASLDLTVAPVTRNSGAEEKWLVVATFGQARLCNVTNPPTLDWRSIDNINGSPICSVAVRDDTLYLGTLNGGLQHISLAGFLDNFDSPVSEASSLVVRGTILEFINRPTELLAVSTTGLFHKDDSVTSGVWPQVAMPNCPTAAVNWPAAAMILTAHKTDTATWISTATDGLWQLRGATLCRVDGVAPLFQ